MCVLASHQVGGSGHNWSLPGFPPNVVTIPKVV
jgi:hypothetical protein